MAVSTAAHSNSQPVVPARARMWSLPEIRWAALALALFLLGLIAQLADGPTCSWWALYLACYLCGGWEPAIAGLTALRERTLDVDLLMVVAAIGAASIGQITDGALLIVIFATSGALEAFATARTEDSVRGLLDLAPETATLVNPDGTEREVGATDLDVGDVLIVRPGERIPADASVISGASEVNQATITGEPLPVDKTIGDEVFAGTLNGTGMLTIHTDRRAEDSVVARIAALVDEAGRTKAKTQMFIEKIEQRYSIGMVAATVAVFAIPLAFGSSLQHALLRAMTFMIVASPCAVVLATMPPLLAAIATAGRHGVLAKSAIVMEQLGTITRVAFDKTGTLTRGEPEVAAIRSVADEFDDYTVLRLAAAAEHPSEHPLGAAVVRAARARGIAVPRADDFSAHPGRGVRARADGRSVEVGSPAVLPAGDHPWTLPVTTAIDELQHQGCTAVMVVVDGAPAGALAIHDSLRTDAHHAVAASAAVTGARPILLTGDNAVAARQLAAQIGITDVRSELLPHDKVAAVRELQSDGSRVAVVGDGINDAPALTAAQVGIAMGGTGSDLTLQSADAVVVRDSLIAIPTVINLARRARRLVIANLVIAALFIAVLVAWDLVGTLPLPLGVAGHEGSTVVVGLNGLRLLRNAAWLRAGRAP